jgi:hypothetical protein
MKIKTAVEILEISLLGIVSFDSEVLRNKYKERFKVAKEMEKEQIINAHGDEQSYLQDDGSWKTIYAEEYYNETFKNETK